MTDQPTSKLLIAEPPLQVLPSLAVRIGLNESIFVQELHYMLINPKLGKTADGRKWIHCTVQEWHKTFPFWSVNTIRGIIGNLVAAKIILEDNLNETLSRRKWYAIDYETLEKKTIKAERKRRTDYPNFGYTMKQRKANPPVSPNFGRSNVQTLDNDSSKDSSKDSFKLSTDVDNLAAPEKESLTDTERHLLKNCQDGKVIEAYYNPVDVKHLVELSLIERCMCGVRPALCLTGQCNGAKPQTLTVGKVLIEPPSDPVSAQVNTMLASIVQPSNEVVIDPDRETHEPSKSPTWREAVQETLVSDPPPAPALPEVPEGYVLRYAYEWAHWLRNTKHGRERNIALCGQGILTETPMRPIEKMCPDCIEEYERLKASAAAPSAKAGRAKKPPLKQPDKPIKDALALLMFGGVDLVNGSWALIVRLWNDLECPPLVKVQKLVAYWPHDWRVAKNPLERPSVAVIKTIWDVAQHWTVPGETPAIDCTDDGEEF